MWLAADKTAASRNSHIMILIISTKADAHIEPVTRHLDAAGMPWIRVNTEDIARNLELTVEPASGQGTLRVRDSGREINLQAVRAVWYRKPEPVDVSHFELDQGALDYVESEFREILDNLFALLSHVPWINNPLKTKLAHRKMLQLQVAKKVGFSTPPTLVTNSADAALRFSEQLNSDLAIKSLGALCVTENTEAQTTYGLFTRRVSRAELEEVKDKVCNLPTTFQKFIEKRCELRVTCIGDKVFSCRIEARPGDLTADDYRFDAHNLNHVACEYPNLHERIRAYMRELQINFACFDFIVPLEGEPIFLEANCNGQWLWVENLTGLPIGEAIADEFLTAIQTERIKAGG
jgi:glutathione synthase/RimK-type ligase-like ATP-grasp enzyme